MAVGSTPAIFIDASALIGLSRIDRLDLLALLPAPCGVTDAVWAEVTGSGRDLPGEQELLQARAIGLFEVVAEGDLK